MHGQKRSEYKSRLLNPEASTKLATKAQQWNHLSHELLTQRRRLFGALPPVGTGIAAGDDIAVRPSPEILLALTEKMLTVNPDPSHLWNIRREMLLYVPSAGNDGAVADDLSENITNNDAPTESSSLDIQAELTLTAHCMQRNPKSYSAWYHRKWSLVNFFTYGPSSPESNTSKQHLNNMKVILQSELDLCAQFLRMDERNFHGWNYRRFVVALLGSCGGNASSSTDIQDEGVVGKPDVEMFDGSWSSWLNQSEVSMGAQLSQSAIAAVGLIPSNTNQGRKGVCLAKSIMPLSRQELEEIITNEWDFTTSKIQDNFSNGSAFHYRSKLLPLILESRLSSSCSDTSEGVDIGASPSERYGATLSLAREEWENILLNAVFTEPDDQTPWWYHRFIVSWARPSDDLDDEIVDEYEALLFEMADSLRDLLEVERENDMQVNAESKDESKGAKCKWAYIGLHLVLSTLLESKSLDKEEVVDLSEEAKECLAELLKIDPNRRERYQNLAAEIS
ncbi:hypothetical protein ACHAXR_003623 [Thalassiosira sp. AJA248-18]